jgi:hypothetical protein
MARPVHPDKDIEAAVSFAESQGWRHIPPGNSAHAWGSAPAAGAEIASCRSIQRRATLTLTPAASVGASARAASWCGKDVPEPL